MKRQTKQPTHQSVRQAREPSPSSRSEAARTPRLQLPAVPLTSIPVRAPVQARDNASGGGLSSSQVHAHADRATSGASSRLPHLNAIQKSLPDHDLSFIRAHTDSGAKASTRAMGAKAFARADRVAFAESSPSLHTVAHEVAHSLQQKAGISIASGVGSVGDAHERQADSVADAVVGGRNASGLLRPTAPSAGRP